MSKKLKHLYKGLSNHKLLTQGNGLLGIPGDFTADSRFIRAAMLASLLGILETILHLELLILDHIVDSTKTLSIVIEDDNTIKFTEVKSI